MTRPLALIEGDLTIPLPRPFDGLPPPFGTRRRVMREAVQQAVEQVAKSARAFLFPPGAKHILFYKAPPQRVDNGRWDAALAEAKRYLEMSTTTRPRSSRSDHLLAASIFAGCTIALTWLLVTCSMKEAEKVKTASVTPAVAAWQAEIAAGKPAAETVVASAVPAASASVDAAAKTHVAQAVPVSPAMPKPDEPLPPVSPAAPKQAVQVTAVASAAPAAASASLVVETGPLSSVVPKQVAQVLPKQTVQVIARDGEAGTPPAKPAKRVKVARLSEAHVNERMAMSRATHPATQPAISKQPEWTAGASRLHDNVSTDDAPWRNWSAQQHRPSPTIRAATPLDNSWNDHMTQRRITDDPAAFHTGGSRQ
ncbi:hypothetical protein PQR70_22580 [Paraburkholderia madseniana]|uniref:hypothetical protein n=1 Tax=Paraburkholderia madseniana TaxID=2599607 RepID=UPI0038BA9400